MIAPIVDADDRNEPGDPYSLEQDFADLSRLTAKLTADITARLAQDPDTESACLLLLDLREARKALHDLEATVEAEAAQRHRGRELRFEGYVAEFRGGRRPADWQLGELTWRLIQPWAVDQQTGEVDPITAVKLDAVRERLLEAYAVTPRTTKLREFGIDPDEFCTYVDSRRTVTVRRDVAEEAT